MEIVKPIPLFFRSHININQEIWDPSILPAKAFDILHGCMLFLAAVGAIILILIVNLGEFSWKIVGLIIIFLETVIHAPIFIGCKEVSVKVQEIPMAQNLSLYITW